METAIQKREISDILRAALRRRRTSHGNLSIRGLALRMELSPSYLSKIFRGEKSLPLRLLPHLKKHLQLDLHEEAEIQQRLLSKYESKELGRPDSSTEKDNRENPVVIEYDTLGRIDFWLLENWYHIPILNLVTTNDFNSSPEWISQRLGITEKQVIESMTKMIEFGYLKTAEGKIQRTQRKLRFPTEKTNPKVRAFHQSMLAKASEQLTQKISPQDFQQRLISGVSVAGNPEKVQEAKLIVEKALYQAAEVLTNGPCTEIYQLNTQLFPVTQIIKKGPSS